MVMPNKDRHCSSVLEGELNRVQPKQKYEQEIFEPGQIGETPQEQVKTQNNVKSYGSVILTELSSPQNKVLPCKRK